jgi:hypothetical protein
MFARSSSADDVGTSTTTGRRGVALVNVVVLERSLVSVVDMEPRVREGS